MNENTIDWDEKAAKSFARHELDMERKFEKEDANVNITSIEELLSID